MFVSLTIEILHNGWPTNAHFVRFWWMRTYSELLEFMGRVSAFVHVNDDGAPELGRAEHTEQSESGRFRDQNHLQWKRGTDPEHCVCTCMWVWRMHRREPLY